MFIEILKAILFGIVEGITEWLPISSTGHLILLEEFVTLNVSQAFWDMFLVVIQLGAIIAVLVLYFNKLNPFAKTKCDREKKATWMLWAKVIVAVLPAAFFGLLLDDWLTAHLYNFQTVAVTLIIYGLAFIFIENLQRVKQPLYKDFNHLSFKTAFLIGMFQVLALIPGTSRSGATIIGAILLGCSRAIAAEFSFFLAIPVMVGASLLKIVKFFLETGFGFTGTEGAVLITGMLVSFFVSIFAIKFLMGYIRKHDFKAFGYYRIALGIIVLIYAVLFA